MHEHRGATVESRATRVSGSSRVEQGCLMSFLLAVIVSHLDLPTLYGTTLKVGRGSSHVPASPIQCAGISGET